jgi:hypothetical protein
MSLSIPSTSITIFRSTTAQPGWTKITTFNDYMLRIVSGDVFSVVAQPFSTVFTSMPIPGTVLISGSVADTTITIAQMQGHSHGAGNSAPISSPVRVNATAPTFAAIDVFTTVFNPSPGTGFTGGGLSHTHPFTNQPGTVTATGPGSIDFNVKYVDVILAQRN